jgi:hypothetical protein
LAGCEEPESPILKSWQGVYALSDPDLIIGWGSFEQPELLKQLSEYGGTVVAALHVSSSRSLIRGASMMQFRLWSKVYTVLYLENGGGRRYRRTGVGGIFENNLLAAFDRAEEDTSELV